MPVPSQTFPLLLGREHEAAELDDALTLAMQGEPQVVVVGGDAGIGKTTLVTALARRAAERGFSVAVGHGLDIEAGISFGPAIEALAAILPKVEDLGSRPMARRMQVVLDPAAPSSAEQGNLLEDLRLTILEAAASGPLLLVLEDLHWVDASTRDLAVALSRTARGRLMFVVSVRSDDLHRRHPARKALAEMGRVPGGRRVELAPLDRPMIAGMVASVLGERPDPALVCSVLERSEGNPLYAEEILAAGSEAIPAQLSDLFLTRIDALPDGPRELARAASVDGTRIDIDTLAHVTGLEQVRLDEFLRVLLDANVLRHEGDSLKFRHPLLREAVYDDLLPDERTRNHAGFAAVLQTRADAEPNPGMSMLGRLAFHWDAARDLPRSLEASLRAGLVAKRLGAGEAVTQLERALALWDRVPDAETVAGRPQIEIVVLIGEAAGWQGDDDGWSTYARRAVEMVGSDTEALVASRAYSALGACALAIDDRLAAQDAIRRSVELAGDSPTEQLAYALCSEALLNNATDRSAAALEVADHAIGAARAANATDALVRALACRSSALTFLGRLREGSAVVEEAIAVARSAGMVVAASDLVGQLAYRITESGQVEAGTSIARAGYDEAMSGGVPMGAVVCGERLVTAFIRDGRFDKAEQLLEMLRSLTRFDTRWWSQADLSLARGEPGKARRVMPESASLSVVGGTHPNDYDILRELHLADLLDNEPRARPLAEAYLNSLEDCESPLIAAAAARIGFHALCARWSEPGAQADRIRDQAKRLLVFAHEGVTEEWRAGYHGVQLGLADAYEARLAGEPAVTEFGQAVERADPFGAYFCLEPRLNLAAELLAHGDRDEGRELLVTCWTAAHDMGARALKERATRLANRSRVPLPKSAATRPGPLNRLTPREREVLNLLSTGATNKAIASTLVISEKTASVHVSNVLAKLGVANRGAAAALARDYIN